MSICKHCNTEFNSNAIGGHTRNCIFNPNSKKWKSAFSEFNIDRGKVVSNTYITNYDNKPAICKQCNTKIDYKHRFNIFCNKSCAAKYTGKHKIRTKEWNTNISIAVRNSDKVKHAIVSKKKPYVYKECPVCNNEFILKNKNRIYCSRKCYKLDLDCKYRKKPHGGFRLKSGYGKGGWYRGYWCSSSYELAWIIYSLEHNIKFERNKKYFEYVYNNKVRKYYPDFILSDNKYIEIKGWNRNNIVDIKSAVVKNLTVLYRKDLNKEFDYVIAKYGKDFIRLYEK